MGEKVDKEVDLRGEVCPYTFVKSKLAIEPMESGGILEVTLDHQPATENVPRSMENEGHDVLEVSEIGEHEWKVVIKKS